MKIFFLFFFLFSSHSWGSSLHSQIASANDSNKNLITEMDSNQFSESNDSSMSRVIASSSNDFKPIVKIGALMDFYYLFSPGRSQEGTNIKGRNYDRKSNDFTLSLFEINTSVTLDKISLYADLDFGDFAEQVQPRDDEGVYHNLGQAFLTYSFTNQLTLTAGKFYTHIGYEAIKPIDNWNYSGTYSFTYGGPFWHEGIALKYTTSKGIQSGLFVYDGWDRSSENNREKTLGAQVGYNQDNFHVLFNFIRGPETSRVSKHKTVYEFNTQFSLNETFAIAYTSVFGLDEKSLTSVNGNDYVDKKWLGNVIYINWKPFKDWSFSPRFEIFSDKTKGAQNDSFIFSDQGATKAIDIQSFTFTTTYFANKWSQMRIEYRIDSADQNIWQDGKNSQKDTLNTFSFSWLVQI